MVNSFIDFIKTGKMHNCSLLLNEDLVSLRQQFFNKQSIGFLLWAASYSPDWNETMQKTTLKLVFLKGKRTGIRSFLDNAREYYLSNGIDFDRCFSLNTIEGDETASSELVVTYPEKQFGMLAKALKQKGLKFVPKREGDTVTFTGDDDTLKNIYIVWKVLDAGDDPAKVSLLKPGQDLPDTVKDDYASKSKQAARKNVETLTAIAKTFNLALHLFLVYKCWDNGWEASSSAIGSLFSSMRYLCTEPAPVDETKVVVDQANSIDAFLKSVSVMPSMSETTRFIVSMIYNEVEKNHTNLSRLTKDLTLYNIAYNLTVFKLRAKASEEDKDSKKADDDISSKYATALKNIMKVKTFKEFKDIIASTEASATDSIDATDALEDTSSSLYSGVTNPCAKRRLKLFKDVLSIDTSKPAKVIKNSKWIFAITYTRDLNGVWGRNKPKVDASGKIIETCNKTNAEGITPSNKVIRDSSSHKWIKDNLTTEANSHFKESNWCTTGGLGYDNRPWDRHNSVSYWTGYNGNGKYPYILMMELATGMMYLLGWNGDHYTGFLFESERESNVGLIHGNYCSTVENLQRARKQDPYFEQLMKVVDEAFGNADEAEIKSTIDYLRRNNKMTNNGRLVLRDRTDLKNFREKWCKLANMFTGIVIDFKDGSGIFKNLVFSAGAPTIDLNNVTNANAMFSYARIEKLNLINTSNITDMGSMFYSASITSIDGLDTSHATSISRMFKNIRNFKGLVLPVSVNALDLRSCTDMSEAFFNSGFRKISLMNTNAIENAKNAYLKCWVLDNYPVAEFPSIKDLRFLCSAPEVADSLDDHDTPLSYAEDFAKLFAFCPKLQGKPDFNKFCLKLYEFYVKKGVKFESKAEVDDRGFLVVRSIDDVKQNVNDFNKYPGIAVKISDCSYLFNYMSLQIETLDLSDVANADYMFCKSTIIRLTNVINSDGIKTARHMFEGCTFTALPKMSLKGLSGHLSLFYNTPNPKALPDLVFSSAISLPNINDDNSIDNFLYGLLGSRYDSSYGYSGWSQTWSVGLLRKWVKSICAESFKELQKQIANILKDKNGYIIIKSANVLLELLTAHCNDIQEYFDSVEGFTIDIHDATAMFSSDEVLSRIRDTKLPKLNLAAVLVADSMFSHARLTLTALENCSGITLAANMFKEAVIKDFPEDADFSNIVDGSKMFYSASIRFRGAANGNEFRLKNFRSVENAERMFMYCKIGDRFAKFNLDDFDIRNVKIADHMFDTTTILMTSLKLLHLENAYGMFSDTTFATSRITEIDLPVATNVKCMFCNMQTDGINLQVNKISAAQAIAASRMFYNAHGIAKIGTIDLSRAATAYEIFCDASNLKMLLRPIFKVATVDLTWSFRRCPLNAIFLAHGLRLLARIRAQIAARTAQAAANPPIAV